MGLVARFLETEGFSTIALTPIPEFQRAVGMARVMGIGDGRSDEKSGCRISKRGEIMMRIVGIVCSSPRKNGNTEILVIEALEAAREAGSETELILVSDKKIAPCDGCNASLKSGVCRIEDDMKTIYRSFGEADGIIFGTPSYFHNVSAQAKAVIDRIYVSLLHGKLRGKVAAALVATRRIGGGQILSLLYSYFAVQGMMIAGGGIGYGRDKGDVRQGPGGFPVFTATEEARAVGKRVVKTIQKIS